MRYGEAWAPWDPHLRKVAERVVDHGEGNGGHKNGGDRWQRECMGEPSKVQAGKDVRAGWVEQVPRRWGESAFDAICSGRMQARAPEDSWRIIPLLHQMRSQIARGAGSGSQPLYRTSRRFSSAAAL
jgi:hypothetical protein